MVTLLSMNMNGIFLVRPSSPLALYVEIGAFKNFYISMNEIYELMKNMKEI